MPACASGPQEDNLSFSVIYPVSRAHLGMEVKLPLFSMCLLCSEAVKWLRKSQSGGQLKVCGFIFQSCCAALARKQQRFIPSIGQLEHFDIISQTANLECTASFFLYIYFFYLCWNFKETSTSSHTDKISPLSGITVYERWIISIPGKNIQFFLIKLFTWVSSWFSYLIICTSLVKSTVSA